MEIGGEQEVAELSVDGVFVVQRRAVAGEHMDKSKTRRIWKSHHRVDNFPVRWLGRRARCCT